MEGHAANELHEEVEVIKNTLAKTATELQQVQAQNRALKEDFHRKEDHHLEMIKRKVDARGGTGGGNASEGRMEDDGGALGRTGGGPAVGAGPSALYD